MSLIDKIIGTEIANNRRRSRRTSSRQNRPRTQSNCPIIDEVKTKKRVIGRLTRKIEDKHLKF